jgi:homoserine O-acetyltransferase
LVISVDSDVCFYPEEQIDFVNTLKENKVQTTHHMIQSIKGHDSFLLEPELFQELIKNFL